MATYNYTDDIISECYNHLPFNVKRVFYTYDIPGGEARGAHAHKQCHQFLISVCGSFDVVLNDGSNTRIVTLNRPYFGLHIPPGIWASEQCYSAGSVCLVLASEKYDASDYIRDYAKYKEYVNFNVNNATIDDCKIICLDKHHSERKGNLSVVENSNSTV